MKQRATCGFVFFEIRARRNANEDEFDIHLKMQQERDCEGRIDR
jgi:hypothetical protein